ncbi:MAG: hypothetical protein AAF569_00935 [Pseudomonadota bacterium]
MLRFLNILSVLALSFAFTISSAQAAVNVQGAQELRLLFTKLLDRQKDAQTLAGGELKTTGNVIVEPAGSYYAVTLPNITMIEPDGSRAELGMIAINTVPGDRDGQWKMSLAWPSPVTYINQDGQPTFKIDIGAQRMAGLFDERIESFIKLDAAYQTIRMEHYEDGTIITIPKIDVKMNLEEQQDGIFSGPMTATAENLNISGGSASQVVSIKKAGLKMNIDSMSAADNKAMQDEIDDLAERVRTTDAGDVSNEDRMAVMSTVVEAFESLGNGFTSQYTLEGINITFPENEGSDKPTSMSLAEAGFGLDMQGFKDNNVKLNVRMGYDGLQLTPQPKDFETVGPQSLNFDLSVNDIPFAELRDMAENSMSTIIDNPSATQMVQIQTMMALPQLLTASGTNLTLNNLIFNSPTAQMKASGKVTADSASKIGASGFVNAEIYGLDELLNAAQAAALADKNSSEKSNLAQIFPAVVLLRGTAEQEKDENGKTVSKFRITLDEQGQVMINSTSIDALQGAGQ